MICGTDKTLLEPEDIYQLIKPYFTTVYSIIIKVCQQKVQDTLLLQATQLWKTQKYPSRKVTALNSCELDKKDGGLHGT